MAIIIIFLCVLVPLSSTSVRSDLFYDGFLRYKNLTLDGSATVDNRGIIHLTQFDPGTKGHAFYSHPIKFKNNRSSNSTAALSFSTCFAFAIVPQYPNNGGHGMAFVIARSPEFPTALPKQYLGLFNNRNNGNYSNKIIAVEFDTVRNLEIGDIDENHVGIDLNSLISNASTSAKYYDPVGGSARPINLTSGRRIIAWVDYDSGKKQLNVTLSTSSIKPNQSILSLRVDLSSIMDESMYVGFSASTGQLASSHCVFGWSFNVSGEARSLDLASLPSLSVSKKNRRFILIAASVPLSIFVLVAIGVAIYMFRRLKNGDRIEAWELDVGPHRFSYKELKRATKGFSEKQVIGFGGFGKVYKGTLPDSQTQIAVKLISPESKQGLQEFSSEITTIGRLRHRNLVQLLGWCRRRHDLLLVYDFMPNMSLDKHLFDGPKSILPWEQRYKIIKGVASGLFYLHEGWEQTVIHRDVKAGNVLLDSDLNGRLGDFGLARLYEHGANPSTTRVVGTLGYMAPELTRFGKPTTSSDVFAFGALLLELVCGRRPVDAKALPEEMLLVDVVLEKWKSGEILGVVDPKLGGDYDEAEVVRALKLGLMCSSDWPEVRPTMRLVLSYLEGESEMPQGLPEPDSYGSREGSQIKIAGMEFEDWTKSCEESLNFG